MRIQAVVGQNDGLRVPEFGEDFRLERKVALDDVAFACAEARPVRGRPAGEHADAGILPDFGNVVGRFELFFFAAEFAGGPSAEIIRQSEKDFRPESLKQGPPGFARQC